MALSSLVQDDWSAGIYRGRRAPASAAYDISNGLIDDEGFIYRRGGSTYYSSSNAGETLVQATTVYSPGPAVERVLASSTSHQFAFDGSTAPVQQTSISTFPDRPVSVSGFAIWSGSTTALHLMLYGGSLKASSYSTGTVTVTKDSTTVTGSGTTWTTNVDAGMVLAVDLARCIVKSVDSNTQITLVDPFPITGGSGASYTLSPVNDFHVSTALGEFPVLGPRYYLATAGSPARLVVCTGNRAYLTPSGDPLTLDMNTYHEVPSSVTIIGAQGVGDSVLLFTTQGVWRIDNLNLDVVDAYGNLQQSVTRVNTDLLLWGNNGIAPWETGFVVPGVDDVYMLSPSGSTTPITGDPQNEKIRPMYRDYVASGYTPGLASVWRSHYILPILNGNTWVDTLVCRLDRGAAWTRWTGHSAGTAYTTLAPTSSAAGKLLSVSGQRVTNVTGAFAPTTSNASEADATTHQLQVTTRAYESGQQPTTVRRVRARYECTDDGNGGTTAPSVAIEYSSDQDGGSFTALTDKGEQGGGTGWTTSSGDKYQWARATKKRQRIWFRVTQSNPCATFVLRSLELLVRGSGRQ